MMKFKRTAAVVTTLAFLFSMSTTAAAAGDGSDPISAVDQETGTVYIVVEDAETYFSTFDNAWQAIINDREFKSIIDDVDNVYNDANMKDWYGDETLTFEDALTEGCFFRLKASQTVTKPLTVDDKEVKILLHSGSSNTTSQLGAVSHTFQGAITVENGGSLSFVYGPAGYAYPVITATFAAPDHGMLWRFFKYSKRQRNGQWKPWRSFSTRYL